MQKLENKVKEKITKKTILPKLNLILIIILVTWLFYFINNSSSETSKFKSEIEILNNNIEKNNKQIKSIFNNLVRRECNKDKKCIDFIEKIKNNKLEKIVFKNENCCDWYVKDKSIKLPKQLEENYKICRKLQWFLRYIHRGEIHVAAKPVIYLYPQQKQKIKVELNYKWKIIADYPKYNNKIKGWEVIAYPNGKVVDLRDGKEYSYLFWEWIPSKKIDWNLKEWFIVKWENAREFLQKKLAYLWLTPKEYNEFIVYWYPKMMKNKYNLIHFATKKYTEIAPLKITPKPDSMLRVFMIMKAVDKNTKVKPQILKKFERKWFTVVEWGGSELK